jgi:hypothetical protein
LTSKMVKWNRKNQLLEGIGESGEEGIKVKE